MVLYTCHILSLLFFFKMLLDAAIVNTNYTIQHLKSKPGGGISCPHTPPLSSNQKQQSGPPEEIGFSTSLGFLDLITALSGNSEASCVSSILEPMQSVVYPMPADCMFPAHRSSFSASQLDIDQICWSAAAVCCRRIL
ncbi:hypothetical protein BDV10DRAFT_104113 [Aspergillus recurvatus]